MDELRARIQEDLEGAIEGELLFEPLARMPYAIDASIYEIDPLGIVVPRHWDDVRHVLRYAAEQGIGVHPRGGGTGLAGESLGRGLVLDLGRHFRRILEVGPESITVEPGVVLDTINRRLKPLGRRLGPDPNGSDTCTVGGLIASDTAGARSLKYGSAADHVNRLRVMFAHGEESELGLIPWRTADDDEAEGFVESLGRKIGSLAQRYADLIAKRWPKSPRNRAGYALRDAIKPKGIDLARLVIGSEGTLALVTEAELRTVSIPEAGAAVLLRFARLSDAASAVEDCLADGPSACELYDWRSLSLVRDSVAWARELISEETEAALVVEFEDQYHDAVEERTRRLRDRFRGSSALLAEPFVTRHREEREQLLNLRKAMRPLLLRRSSHSRAVPFLEDIAVPPQALSEFFRDLQNVLRRHEVNWTIYAHAGHGQLHVRPFLDLRDPHDLVKIEPLATEIYDQVFEHGGTVSGEHGCGLARSQYLAKQYGDLIHAFREIKAAFDPHHVLNPGKVLAEDHHQIIRDLRRWIDPSGAQPFSPIVDAPASPSASASNSNSTAASSASSQWSGEPAPRKKPRKKPKLEPALPVLPESLLWPAEGSMEATINACNGCGACRTEAPGLRMCPTYRALNVEAASPRAQANILRQIATGAVDPMLWGSEELKKNADLCLHCTLCRDECPSGVDVSRLMIEAKAAYVQNHGLSVTDWALSRLEGIVRLSSRLPWFYNQIFSRPSLRWALHRLAGVSRHRSLPKLAGRTFLKRARELGLTRPNPHQLGPRAAYFVDVFANYFDPELAETTVSLLQSFGVNVYVPTPQRGSGMSALLVGDVDYARDIALTNLRALGNAVRDGYTIICSEPTAAMMLRREYLTLTDDLDAQAVAENTMDAAQYLAVLDARGLVPKPQIAIAARVGYHQPCHLRSLDVGTPGLDLIRQIPDLKAEFIDRGCSGMAGVFGISRRNFRTSLRAGRGLLTRLRDDDIEIGATECSACRMQMEQGIAKRTVHPIKLLAIAHGLNPALRLKLKEPKPRHEIA